MFHTSFEDFFTALQKIYAPLWRIRLNLTAIVADFVNLNKIKGA
jgi:hypothetical protein